MKAIKILFLGVLPALLLLCAYATFRFASIKGLLEPSPAHNITYQRYSLTKSQKWAERFDYQLSGEYNSIKREILGTRENFLEVRRESERYLIEYDAEIDVELISWVREVREEGDSHPYNGRYFLVQYDRFAEIVFFQIDPKSPSEVYQAQICLQLPIAASDNVRYHIDSHSNIWIVTASMNKVVFIQIYSCIERRVVSEFRHILSDGQNVNQVSKIKRKDECMGIEVVTYGLNLVELEVCPYTQGKSITENSQFRRSHSMEYSEVVLKEGEYGVLQGYTQNIWKEQVNRIAQYIYKFLTMGSTTSLLQDRPPSSDQHKKEKFDAIAIDEQNHYLLDFSGNASSTGIKSLDKFMINAKHPLFHNNPAYNKLDVLKILDREYRQEGNPDIQHRSIIPGLNTTRRATYKAAFRTYPDVKVEHLGITSKVLVFHPSNSLDQKDYTFVRTHEGGLVSEGIKFKGTFDKFPVQYQQIFQRVDAKAQEVVPGVFQAHVGYLNLMTYLIRSKDNQEFSRIELMNMLGGRPVVSHYISTKEGFSYVSTMLLNSQWWILEYNRKEGRSMATKYELYANASSPEKVLNLKRVYGVIGSEQHLNGEDDLAELMSNFVSQHGKGYIFLNIYRCIDEYYYIQYSDTEGKVYGVARVHFKSLSNRRVKKSKKYSGFFQRVLLVDEKDMIPERYSRKPFSVYIKNTDIFSHLPAMLDRNNPKDAWYKFCENSEGGRTFRSLQKLGGFYYFPISHYAIGKYGCDFGSQRPHGQTFSVFNMRSMIIDGKQQIENRSNIRKHIIAWIFGGVGTYLAFALICWLLLGKKENKGEKSSEKKEPIRKEKNN